MAGTAVTPPPPLPPGGSAGVEPVRHRRPDRREARDEPARRRAQPADETTEADEPEPVRPPAGRLDVVA